MNRLFLFFVLLPNICFAENSHWINEKGEEVSDEQVADFISNNIMEGATEQAKEMQPVYESMKTCTPAESQYLQVFGIENNLCHFKYVDYNCLVPLNIAEEYADLGLKSVQEIFNGNLNTQSEESIKIQEILSDKDYCSYKMTWTVTMEDEDGNEVPVEGLIIE